MSAALATPDQTEERRYSTATEIADVKRLAKASTSRTEIGRLKFTLALEAMLAAKIGDGWRAMRRATRDLLAAHVTVALKKRGNGRYAPGARQSAKGWGELLGYSERHMSDCRGELDELGYIQLVRDFHNSPSYCSTSSRKTHTRKQTISVSKYLSPILELVAHVRGKLAASRKRKVGSRKRRRRAAGGKRVDKSPASKSSLCSAPSSEQTASPYGGTPPVHPTGEGGPPPFGPVLSPGLWSQAVVASIDRG